MRRGAVVAFVFGAASSAALLWLLWRALDVVTP